MNYGLDFSILSNDIWRVSRNIFLRLPRARMTTLCPPRRSGTDSDQSDVMRGAVTSDHPTPVTGVTITWHRVTTDKTNLSERFPISSSSLQKKTWTASVRQLAVSVQCGVQVELCYFIDIKIVLCEDKATVQNYCHILAQKVTIKRSFLFLAMLHSFRAGKHKISISRYDCKFLFLISLFEKEFKGWETFQKMF